MLKKIHTNNTGNIVIALCDEDKKGKIFEEDGHSIFTTLGLEATTQRTLVTSVMS
jgi:hypothetical protein